MTDAAHPVDTLLRAVAGEPRATTEDVLLGRRILFAAINAERERTAIPTPRSRRRPSLAFAFGAFVVIAAVALSTVVLRSPPVTALGDLAKVAEVAEPPVAADGEFLYTRSTEASLHIREGIDLDLAAADAVAYLLPIVRERWQGSDGTQERVTVQPPRFFDEAHEAAYFASDLPNIDRVGETIVTDFTDTGQEFEERRWPTDAGELLETMRITVSSQDAMPEAAAVVELAAELLRETGADPELRAAVIGALDLLDVGAVRRPGRGMVIFEVDFVENDLRSRLQLVFDGDANLIRDSLIWLDGNPELGVPPGTAIADVRQLGVGTVAEIGER